MLRKLQTICKRPFVMLTEHKTGCHCYPSGLPFCICNLLLRKYAAHSLKVEKKLAWLRCCVPVLAVLLSLILPVTVSVAVQCLWWGLKGTSELWLFDQSCLSPSWKPLDTLLCLGQGSTLTAVINSLCCEECVSVNLTCGCFFLFFSLRSPRQTSLLLLYMSFIQSLSIF